MKAFFAALFLLVSLNSYSQTLDYTRKYLKTIVRQQMVEIQQLKDENSKLKSSLEEGKIAADNKREEYRLESNKSLENLRIELRSKEMELKERTQEKESAQVAMQQSQKLVEILANQVADLKMATPQYSLDNYVLPERESEAVPVVRRSYRAPRTSYITGPRGGCYYINSNGNKTYVDRSLCQ
ncbi:hypothetical protein LZG74_02035 [Dyadobacter sp. CY327]|uniref:hypothetical protein n=1 Tax=Dyadobacter sp. CY327 TaxID=2907301 RepID=UPI001F371296|nr:hypothetical protein [Dyadobacter sp. CY327]MCE7069063.1 hypothetical protein [Dyadobacter sp. CY327]